MVRKFHFWYRQRTRKGTTLTHRDRETRHCHSATQGKSDVCDKVATPDKDSQLNNFEGNNLRKRTDSELTWNTWNQQGQVTAMETEETLFQEVKSSQTDAGSSLDPQEGPQKQLTDAVDVQSRSSYLKQILTQEEYKALYLDVLKPISALELLLNRPREGGQCYDIHDIPPNDEFLRSLTWKQRLARDTLQ